jgi:hypoxanthine-DNA glycosylase
MSRVKHPFPPVVGEEPRVLVLGTMPSPASVRNGGYYGHPQNDFWPIMGDLLRADLAAKHADPRTWTLRYDALKAARVALWDVLAECVRLDASDASIRRGVANDVPWLLENHRSIAVIALNGRAAQDLFVELVDLGRMGRRREYRLLPLPSTSPAHAVPFEAKLEAWRALAPYLQHSFH